MSLDLPTPVSRYFEATNRHDIDGMLAAFAADATVRDEGRDLAGSGAIRAWMEDTTRRYRVTVVPLSVGPLNAGPERDGTVVTARVSGNFPGSPLKLRYRFRLEGGAIAALEIG